jgi:AcrR family transcriptional regulator
MPHLTPARQEARQATILAAARQVFVEKGLRRATTHDVARAAGVPVGSIYTYFADKDELIWASILAANRDETEAVLRVVRADGTVRDRIRRAVAGWYAYTIEAPGVPAFLAEVWASAVHKPLIRDLVARRRERVASVARVILQDGVARGEIAGDADIETTARTIANILDGFVLESLESNAPLDLEEVERRVLLLLPLG